MLKFITTSIKKTRLLVSGVRKYILAFLVIALGAAGVVIDVEDINLGATMPTPPIIVMDNGEQIEFAYTDSMDGETIGIWTDKSRYANNISTAEVYMAIYVPERQKVDFSTILDAQYTIEKLEMLVESDQVQIDTDRVYEEQCEEIVASTTYMSCAKVLVSETPVYATRYVPQDISFAVENQANGKAHSKISVNNMVGWYFIRANIQFEEGVSDKEFFMEAVGSKGGYGYLDPWFDSAWTYKMPIYIDPANVDTTLTSYPYYVNLEAIGDDIDAAGYSSSTLWDNLKSDGCDIRFTESDAETETAFDLVSASTTAYTGEVHVMVDSLSSSATTTLYMYWGNTAASCYADSATYGAENVWTNYAGVWHREGDALDSTADSHDGTDTSVSYSSTYDQIGQGGTYDGSTSRTLISNDTDFTDTDNLTMSAWINVQSTSANSSYQFFAKSDNITTYMYFRVGTDGSNVRTLKFNGDTDAGNLSITGSTALNTDTWYHAVVTYDKSNLNLYLNGSTDATQLARTNNLTPGTGSVAFGRLGDFNGQYFNGYIGEARWYVGALSADWIATEFSNQSSPSTFQYVGEPVSSEWYDSGWGYRFPITASSTKVDADLTDYPAYYDCNNAPSGFWTNVDSDFDDVRITTANGVTEVAREVVTASTTAETCEIHFLAPSMESATGTTFYIYYGSSTAAAPADDATYGRDAVWANYESVHHLKDLVDGSGNGYTLTNNNSITFGDTGAVIGDGAIYDDTENKYLGTSTSAIGYDTDVDRTWETWVNLDSGSISNQYLLANMTTQGQIYFIWYTATNNIKMFANGNEVTSSNISADTDYHLVTTKNGSEYEFFMNGVSQGTTTEGSLTYNDDLMHLGATNTGTLTPDGTFDELRLSTVAISSDFITTEYNNQSSPTTFWSVGAEEEESPAAEGDSTRPPEVIFFSYIRDKINI